MIRFALWAVSAMMIAAPVAAQSFEEANVVRWGADYSRIPMKSGTAAACARACAKDERCKSWTFARAGVEGKDAMCRLKGAVPERASNPCCVSGVSGGSSVRAFAETPRVRPAKSLAAVQFEPTGMTGALGTMMGLTPSGMTGSLGAKTLEATGMTGSIGAPALSPLQPAVMEPASEAPYSIQPESWDNQQP
jgi:hypothetical protein